jgi:putative component of toxin-antitoxin plasmid stabilization module
MGFKIVRLANFIGEEASIYSIFDEIDDSTLLDRFIKENIVAFKSEILDIVKRLKTINTITGAKEYFFKLDEGLPGDGVCALYDNPDSHLRLYCIRYGNSLVIIGGGGEKRKEIRTWQESEKLAKEANRMIGISKKITLRIKEREIEFEENGTKLTGNLEFYEDEEIS